MGAEVGVGVVAEVAVAEVARDGAAVKAGGDAAQKTVCGFWGCTLPRNHLEACCAAVIDGPRAKRRKVVAEVHAPHSTSVRGARVTPWPFFTILHQPSEMLCHGCSPQSSRSKLLLQGSR